jgi:hypothetical protein
MPIQIKKIFNTHSPNYIKLDYDDYVTIESFLPVAHSSEWASLTPEEQVTCDRVRGIIHLMKEAKENAES